MKDKNIDELIKNLEPKDLRKILKMIKISLDNMIAVGLETAIRDFFIMADYKQLKKEGKTALQAFYELSQQKYNGQQFSESSINFIVYRKYQEHEKKRKKKFIGELRRK